MILVSRTVCELFHKRLMMRGSPSNGFRVVVVCFLTGPAKRAPCFSVGRPLGSSMFRTSWSCRSGPTSGEREGISRRRDLQKNPSCADIASSFHFLTACACSTIDHRTSTTIIQSHRLFRHEAIWDDGSIISRPLSDRRRRGLDGFASPPSQGSRRGYRLSALYCHE